MTALVTNKSRKEQLESMMTALKPKIGGLLPSGIEMEHFCGIALLTVRSTPGLMKCDPLTVMGAIMRAANLGCQIGPNLGQGWLVPFKGRCEFLLGYKGMIKLANNSPKIGSWKGFLVFNDDIDTGRFKYLENESGELFSYETNLRAKRDFTTLKDVAGCLSVARAPDGRVHSTRWMPLHEIEMRRGRGGFSKGGFSPWKTDPHPMATKTGMRGHGSQLPLESRPLIQLGREDMIDAGKIDELPALNPADELAGTGETFDVEAHEADASISDEDAGASSRDEDFTLESVEVSSSPENGTPTQEEHAIEEWVAFFVDFAGNDAERAEALLKAGKTVDSAPEGVTEEDIRAWLRGLGANATATASDVAALLE